MKHKIKQILTSYCTTDMTLEDASQQVLDLFSVSQRSELFFCDYCKEDNPHKIDEHTKTKECEGCGLITKI